jgi:S1-C subfamily serine protease
LLEKRRGLCALRRNRFAPNKGGLESGDVIVKVGDKPIRNLPEFKEAMKAVGKPDYLLLRILRGKNYAFVLLDLTDKDKTSTDKRNNNSRN